MSTRREAVIQAAQRLKAAGIEIAFFEAQLLLAEALGLSTLDIVAQGDVDLGHGELIKYEHFVSQRERRKPLAYIIGKKPFLHWEFMVNEDVLIPRPETELLVELAVGELKQNFPQEHLRLADIGVGSGAIGLSMLALLPSARLVAVDISEPALAVARQNAAHLNLLERATFYPGDLLNPLESWREIGFHCISANLPYVSAEDYSNLQSEVSKYEPRTALVSGADGLRHYRHFLRDVREYLVPGGYVFTEIGSTQAEQVQKLFTHGGFACPQVKRDLAGLPRIVWARKE